HKIDLRTQNRIESINPVLPSLDHSGTAIEPCDPKARPCELDRVSRAATPEFDNGTSVWPMSPNDISDKGCFGGIIFISIKKVIILRVIPAKHAHWRISNKACADLCASSSVRPTPLGR